MQAVLTVHKKASIVMDRTRRTVVAAIFLLGTACQFSEPRAAQDSDRIPGQYIVSRAQEPALCEAAKSLVNKLPRQDLGAASSKGTSRVLRWNTEPRYEEPGSQAFFPVTHLSIKLDGNELPSPVLRYSGMLAGTPSDALYVLPPGAPLPKDGLEVQKLLRSTAPAYASYAGDTIARLRQLYGENWESWYLAGQVAVAAIEIDNRTYFAAQQVGFSRRNNPSSILVFSLDAKGEQRDVCMLRRICPCNNAQCVSSYRSWDQAKVTPSNNQCRK
jgi:hypothetical protein